MRGPPRRLARADLSIRRKPPSLCAIEAENGLKYGFAGLFLGLVAALASTALATPARAYCAVKAPPGLVAAGSLTVGSNMSTPPQMYIDKGEPAGFEIDLAKAIAAKMCLKPV